MNEYLIGALVLFVGGYVASIYTWPKLREKISGVEAEIERLKKAIEALKDR